MNTYSAPEDVSDFIADLIEKPAMVAGHPIAAHGIAMGLAAMLISSKTMCTFSDALIAAFNELQHVTGEGASHRNYVPCFSADTPELDSSHSYRAFSKNAERLFRRI